MVWRVLDSWTLQGCLSPPASGTHKPPVSLQSYEDLTGKVEDHTLVYPTPHTSTTALNPSFLLERGSDRNREGGCEEVGLAMGEGRHPTVGKGHGENHLSHKKMKNIPSGKAGGKACLLRPPFYLRIRGKTRTPLKNHSP